MSLDQLPTNAIPFRRWTLRESDLEAVRGFVGRSAFPLMWGVGATDDGAEYVWFHTSDDDLQFHIGPCPHTGGWAWINTHGEALKTGRSIAAILNA